MIDNSELEGQISETAGELSVWRSLMEHPGWKQLMEVLQGQLNTRTPMLRTPLSNMDAVLGQEFTKGEAAGLELFAKLPEIQLETLQAQLESLTKELENAEGTIDEVGVDGRGGVGDKHGRDELLNSDRDAFGDG